MESPDTPHRSEIPGPAVPATPAFLPRRRRTRRWLAGAALLGAGATGGGIMAATMSAGAATTAPTTAASGSASNPATGPTGTPPAGGPHGQMALSLSGTVTAVGTSSVTIQTSTATTTYAVTSSSDIDKNGEATLKDLAVGDAVNYSVDSSATTPAIDKLHAGSESLDRPTGPPPGGTTGSAQTGTAPSGSATSDTAA